MSALTWQRADAYHLRSQCGRFTVARITVGGIDWYTAHETQERGPSIELGSRQLSSARPTDAERLAAIAEMKALCESATKEPSA